MAAVIGPACLSAHCRWDCRWFQRARRYNQALPPELQPMNASESGLKRRFFQDQGSSPIENGNSERGLFTMTPQPG